MSILILTMKEQEAGNGHLEVTLALLENSDKETVCCSEQKLHLPNLYFVLKLCISRFHFGINKFFMFSTVYIILYFHII